eukprot:TRINITY_DN1807_c0_g1_i3.p1 TRINITY_DN1807_c0_g1~~TRINITY_DN1807_c0_g1_i3.p1  ORF type:complete len:421 (-),score=55.08 TRINITY_DN1807_c0_g1_i3:702-1964(-)
MEALMASYRAKCDEETLVRSHLDKARFDAQQLLIRLRTSGVKDNPSLIPANVRAGNGLRSAELVFAERKHFLQWLAATVDMSQLREFYAPGDVMVGETRLSLGRMIQLRLSGSSDVLRLSVLVDITHAFLDLLSRTRRGVLGQGEFREHVESWRLIAGEVLTDGEQPAIFLINRGSSQAIVVGSWPALQEEAVVPALPPASGGSFFDPVHHFGLATVAAKASKTSRQSVVRVAEITFLDGEGNTIKLNPGKSGGIEWSINGSMGHLFEKLGVYFTATHQCTISGPFGPTTVAVPSSGLLRRELARHIVVMAVEQRVLVRCENESKSEFAAGSVSGDNVGAVTAHSIRATNMSKVFSGDRVEVEYRGEWFRGVVQCVDGDVARVRCDADEPSVITLAHISNVRPATRLRLRHARSKSSACP